MTAVTLKGLDALRRRFDSGRASRAVFRHLAREAERLAAGAAENAPGRLGETVEVIEESRGDRPAFAIGTAHRAGRFLEYGTVRRPATPWLWPIFRARLPRVKQGLTNTLRAALARR